ncbi:FkbM family methyltransferase [Nitrospira sp. KM1]|uniref:FkbM family methyltransferase n=1 Tax=Nitrospira sp. KM1 TaxID=1936990 RepID=UPI001567A5A0|nr:FkbM family methyltransferase [Nitrospira sp. KM1]
MRYSVKTVIPAAIRRPAREMADLVISMRSAWSLGKVRRRAEAARAGEELSCLEFRVRINDGPNFYVLYHDIFVRGIYRFDSRQPDPLILDCGSNVGMSILYFKHLYPQARIIGFEPDPAIVKYLEDNVATNDLSDVQIVQAAVGGREGSLTFYSDGKYGSCLAHLTTGGAPAGWSAHAVPCVKLRDYLHEPVDFLKMNIEGAEWEALADSGDRLRSVNEMAIEYHHLPGLPRTLHKILGLLDELGFDSVVSDFNLDTYSGARPPLTLNSQSSYFRHIYAKRRN